MVANFFLSSSTLNVDIYGYTSDTRMERDWKRNAEAKRVSQTKRTKSRRKVSSRAFWHAPRDSIVLVLFSGVARCAALQNGVWMNPIMDQRPRGVPVKFSSALAKWELLWTSFRRRLMKAYVEFLCKQAHSWKSGTAHFMTSFVEKFRSAMRTNWITFEIVSPEIHEMLCDRRHHQNQKRFRYSRVSERLFLAWNDFRNCRVETSLPA